MKKYLMIVLAALAVALTGCGGDSKEEDKDTKLDITGIWQLTRVETRSATIGSQTVNVYIEFSSGSFTLYQNLGGDRYEKFTGTYSLYGNLLSGTYSTGASLASTYTVEVEGSTMTLTTSGGQEADVYSKISAIPQTVIDSVLEQS